MTVEDPGAPPAESNEFWLFGYGSLVWKPPPHFDSRIPGWVNGYVRRFWQASQDHRGTPEAPGRVVTLIERSFWATLEDPHPAPRDGKVWGVAYRIKPAYVAEVKEYLDIREINGYSIHYTPFHPAPGSSSSSTTTSPSQPTPEPIRTLVYIGTPTNDQFTGPQPIQALAEHIYRSTGPSGPNRAYLLSLDTALRELMSSTFSESGGGGGGGEEDEHIADLSRRVRALIAREEEEEEEEKEKEQGRREDSKSRPAGVVMNGGAAAASGQQQQQQQQHQAAVNGVDGSVDEQEETEKVVSSH